MPMKRTLVFTLALLIGLPISASELHVENAYVPEAPPVAPVMAGYLDLVNPTSKPITITAVQGRMFERVEIHNMSMKNGMMHMQQLEKLTIPANGKVSLSPGGYHLMLIKPKKAFHDGDTIQITLQLANGDKINLKLPVESQHTQDHSHH